MTNNLLHRGMVGALRGARVHDHAPVRPVADQYVSRSALRVTGLTAPGTVFDGAIEGASVPRLIEAQILVAPPGSRGLSKLIADNLSAHKVAGVIARAMWSLVGATLWAICRPQQSDLNPIDLGFAKLVKAPMRAFDPPSCRRRSAVQGSASGRGMPFPIALSPHCGYPSTGTLVMVKAL